VTRTGEAVGRVRTSSSNDVYPPATGLGVEVGQVYGSMSQIHTLTQDRITVLAGIGEEIFVLVLPYTALRLVRLPARWAREGVCRGLPLTVVVSVCVALRMSYHVYYGPGSVSLLPWAVLTVLVFHRWRLLTPLVFTHIAYDSVLSTANHGLITTTEEFTVLCAATVVLLVVGAVRANFRSIVSREGSAAGVEPIAPR